MATQELENLVVADARLLRFCDSHYATRHREDRADIDLPNMAFLLYEDYIDCDGDVAIPRQELWVDRLYKIEKTIQDDQEFHEIVCKWHDAVCNYRKWLQESAPSSQYLRRKWIEIRDELGV